MVYRKRARKSMKKRRVRRYFKKKGYRKKKYDGIVFRKVFADAYVTHDSVAANGTVSINFGSAVAPANGYIRHTSTPEWI